MQTKFLDHSLSVVNILSPERRLYCGVDLMGPDHHVNVAQEVHNR